MITRILLILLGVLLLGQSAAATTPEERYAAAEKALAKHSDSFWLDGTSGGRAALDEYWAAAQDWTVWYLNSHAQMPPQEISERLKTQVLNRGVEVGLEKIGADLYAGSAGYGEIGNVFLIAKRDGRFAVVWDIRHATASETAKFPTLTAWATDHARDPCPLVVKDDERLWDRCGPIHGIARLLPPDASGRIRFYITATYAQSMGSDVAGQLSIWSWDGTTATPLLAGTYGYTIGDEDPKGGVRQEGNVLHIREKGQFRSVFVSAPEPGRRLDWQIRVAANGVQDLGLKAMDPALDFVDQVVAAALQKKPLEPLASARAARVLSAVAKSLEQDTPSDGIGELMGSGVRKTARGAEVCFLTDALGEALLFVLERRNGGFFLTDVSKTPDNPLCGFPQKQG